MKFNDESKLKKIFIDFKTPTKVYAFDDINPGITADEEVEILEESQLDLSFTLFAIIPNEKIDKCFQDVVNKIDSLTSYNSHVIAAAWIGDSDSLVIISESPDCQVADEFNEKWKFERALADESSLDVENFYDNDGVIYANPNLCKRIWKEMLPYKAPSSNLTGKSFCFTGFRDKETEAMIISLGGTISNTVTKDLTYLVKKSDEEESSKIEKAENLGINIISFVQLLREIL